MVPRARKTSTKPDKTSSDQQPDALKVAAKAKLPAKAVSKAPSKAKPKGDVPAAPENVTAVLPEAPTPEPSPRKPKKGKTAPPLSNEPLTSPEDVFSPDVRKVVQAIQSGCAIELVFKDAESNPARTFEPRQICFDVFTNQWFVWGWDRRYNAERHHRLDLIAAVNLVEGVGRSAQGPYKDGTPANRIGGWLGGEPIPVKALISKQWIFAVKQAPLPFPEFRIEEQEDGKALVSFVATDLRAIARWCMQYGDGIQIQEPQRLVDRLRQAALSWGVKPLPVQLPPPPKTPKPEHRQEAKPLPKPEPKASPRPESSKPRESEEKPASSKNARVEVRIERL